MDNQLKHVPHACGIPDFVHFHLPQVETCGYDVDHGYAVWGLIKS
jgi:hypothetical protein